MSYIPQYYWQLRPPQQIRQRVKVPHVKLVVQGPRKTHPDEISREQRKYDTLNSNMGGIVITIKGEQEQFLYTL